jgi:acetolactate synthase-1/2/3 large subunit
MVDIDESELKKPTLKIDLPIHANVADVMREILKRPELDKNEEHQKWLQWSLERKRRYPVTLDSYWDTKNCVNPYCFVDCLTEQLEENERIVTGDGTACVVTFQAAKIKKGQRLYTNSGCASMGYDLPAAVGAYFSERPKRLICLAGDGSIQMNLQELQTTAKLQSILKSLRRKLSINKMKLKKEGLRNLDLPALKCYQKTKEYLL